MQPIHIRRSASPSAPGGTIEPEDRSWCLTIDAEGIPHLSVRTQYEADDGSTQHGYVSVEDFLIGEGEVDIKCLMRSTFQGKLTPEEEEAAYAEHEHRADARLGC